uniref:adhesion G protein-coupled receptor L2 isoform X2 n=1 Tax=Ciona intestinalis TaxID=7719 RepID=UPI000EF44715|nr:adhesion G protein-coupled receptor L2 isoform X2 [Ciona intestinalis]|eukprot:XP_026692592.1 adhesion G protein-coupled receptor L2 isoform X2 [Ciona intestinalis]
MFPFSLPLILSLLLAEGHCWKANCQQVYNSGRCSVNLYSISSYVGIPNDTTVNGTVLLDSACIVLSPENHLYAFAFNSSGSKIDKKCMCTVDVWTESSNKYLVDSKQVQNYLKREKNRTTCSQILGIMLWPSWRNRIKPVNFGEVDAVINAFTNLTSIKISDVHKFLDNANVLLDSTKKIASYQFYEGMGNDSGGKLIEKTAKGISNLLIQWKSIQKIKQKDEVSESLFERTSMVEKPTTNESHVRTLMFDTMESITQSIAKRLLPPDNGSELLIKASESQVDVQVTLSTNPTSLVNQTHSELSRTNNVTVIMYPATNSSTNDIRSFAVISVFYDFPWSSDTDRVSSYMSVNARNYVKGDVHTVSVPVRFSLLRGPTRKNAKLYYRPVCAFLVPNSQEEEWDTYGCTAIQDKDYVTTCECNHTTHFAILMKAFGDELPEPFNKSLEVLSMILSAISIALLSVTILIFITYRRVLLKDRMLIHFHLIIALLGGYVSLLVGSAFATHNEQPTIPCIISAMVSHYFFLVVFMWSLVEGVYLFYKIILVFHKKSIECLQRFAPLVGWLTPALVVIVAFIVSRTTCDDYSVEKNSTYIDQYANATTCFLTSHNGMIWSFLGPVLFIIALNMVVLVRVSMVIYTSAYTSTRLSAIGNSCRISNSLKRSSRGALILMPILGIPWIVGLLANLYANNSNVGMVVGTFGSYLQVLLVGGQGIAVFVFYCFYNSEVRGAYMLAAKKRKSEDSLDAARRKKNRASSDVQRAGIYMSMERLSVSTLNLLNIRRSTNGSIRDKQSYKIGAEKATTNF